MNETNVKFKVLTKTTEKIVLISYEGLGLFDSFWVLQGGVGDLGQIFAKKHQIWR